MSHANGRGIIPNRRYKTSYRGKILPPHCIADRIPNRACGWALASAHARSGDPAIISGYIGKSDILPKAIAQFAETYARQSEDDHRLLIDAIRDGIIEAYTE